MATHKHIIKGGHFTDHPFCRSEYGSGCAVEDCAGRAAEVLKQFIETRNKLIFVQSAGFELFKKFKELLF